MADIYLPAMQRPALLELVKALGCRDSALRRDHCGDWAIFGKQGQIYAVPGSLDRSGRPGFQIMCLPDSARAWGFAKKAMSFAAVTQDGDSEGGMFLDRLPTPVEAGIVRDKLGIAKKRVLSEAELERLASIGHRFVARGHDVAGDIADGKPAPDVSTAISASTAIHEGVGSPFTREAGEMAFQPGKGRQGPS